MKNLAFLLKVPARLGYRVFRTVYGRCTNKRCFNGASIRVSREVAKIYPPVQKLDYEIYEWEAVHKFGKPGDTFLDIGANIGILSVAMSRIAGKEGQVIACEPNPASYRLLSETIDLNSCENVLPLQVLLHDCLGSCKFYISPVGSLGVRSSVANLDAGAKEVKLPTLTLDFLMQNFSKVDYMKIDVEGAELRVLCGAKQTLVNYKPLVQIEVHGHFMCKIGDTVENLFDFMVENGYESINLITMTRVTSAEFTRCTHHHVRDTATGEEIAFQGYGQVLFVPQERKDVFAKLIPRECKVCQLGSV
ncbi:MAG: FkbM family methyltransferase [Desulfobacteraceae bacterium]|nr:FkbM family methyltransferase [Desulfobacteraceae bacterium]